MENNIYEEYPQIQTDGQNVHYQQVFVNLTEQQRIQIIQGFKQGQKKQDQDPNHFSVKKNLFRTQTRRQYLKAYFENKRKQYFGWEANKKKKSENDSSIEDINSDRNGQTQQDNSTSADMKPCYNSNYFNSISLLQKLILKEQATQIQIDQNNQRFKYQSFYHFLMDIIQQNLDKQYFNKYNDKMVYLRHFNQLKKLIYKNLYEELELFVMAFNQYKNKNQKQNTWYFEKICGQTFQSLLLQLDNFINNQNLYHYDATYENQPHIDMCEQLTYLLNLIIIITYYDDPVYDIEENHQKFYKENGQQSSRQNYKSFYQKYNQMFNSQQIESTNNIKSITQIFIDSTSLLNTLKFLIVFGPLSEDSNDNQRFYKQQKSKDTILKSILVLLTNLIYNIGSDCLFQSGIMAELKVIQSRPCYKYNIRRNQKNVDQIIKYWPIMYEKINTFMIESFVRIRKQQNFKYLSDMDAAQFTINYLQKLSKRRQYIRNKQFQDYNKQDDYGQIRINNEILLIEQRSNNEIQINSIYDNGGRQYNRYEKENMSMNEFGERQRQQYNNKNERYNEWKEMQINRINEIGQISIGLFKLLYYIGQWRYHKNNQQTYYQQLKNEHLNNQLQTNMQYNNELNKNMNISQCYVGNNQISFQEFLSSIDQNDHNKNNPNNAFMILLKSLHCQNVLQQFEYGRQFIFKYLNI